MYPQHFRLTRRLFGPGIAQDDAMFVGEAQSAAAAHVGVALSSADSAVLLLGDPGVGKTTLAASALRSTSAGMRITSAWLPTPPTSPHDLLELLLAEFGFDPYKHSRVERLHTWRQFLTECGATGTRVFIAVERAQEVEPNVLQALDSLTTADPNGCPGANLILMGREELVEHLDLPALASLRQRVRLVRRIEPLDDAGVEAYLRHVTAAAGGAFDALFADDAIEPLAAYSGGIPRVLNHLCDSALALAAERDEPNVTAELVNYAATQLYGMPALEPGSLAREDTHARTRPHVETRTPPSGRQSEVDEAPRPREQVAAARPEHEQRGTPPPRQEQRDAPPPRQEQWDAPPRQEQRDAPPRQERLGAPPRQEPLGTPPARPEARGTPPPQERVGAPAARHEQARTAPPPQQPLRRAPPPAAVEEIPTLTETVDDLDLDGALAPNPAPAATASVDPAATLTLFEDGELDDLSAELAAAILSDDDSEWVDIGTPASEPRSGEDDRNAKARALRAVR